MRSCDLHVIVDKKVHTNGEEFTFQNHNPIMYTTVGMKFFPDFVDRVVNIPLVHAA